MNKQRSIQRRSKVIKDVEIIDIAKESKKVKDPFEETEISDYMQTPFSVSNLSSLYELNTWHYRCCNIKAKSTCGLGHRIAPVDGTELNDNSPEYKKLAEFLKRPNDRRQSFSNIMYQVMIDYEAFGNAFIEIDMNNKKEIQNIYHVPAYTVRVKKDYSGYWQLRGESQVVEFNDFYATEKNRELNSLIHIKSYYPKSDYYGMPDFIPAMSAMLLDNNADEFNINFFNNSAIPALAVVTKGGKLSPEAKTKIKSFFTDQVKGLDNSHRTLLIPLEGQNMDIKFEKLMENVKEASFTKIKEMNRDEVVAAHGVPPRMIGIMASGQLGGSGEAWAQMKQFKEMLINPTQSDLEFELQNMIEEGFDIKDLFIKFNEIEIDNPKDDADRIIGLVGAKVLTADEGRSEMGYDPFTDEQKEEMKPEVPENPEMPEHEELAGTLEKVKKYIEDELNG